MTDKEASPAYQMAHPEQADDETAETNGVDGAFEEQIEPEFVDEDSKSRSTEEAYNAGYTPDRSRLSIPSALRAEAYINGHAATVIVDTGCLVTTISEDAARKFGLSNAIDTGATQDLAFETASGEKVRPVGCLRNVPIRVGNLVLRLNAQVSHGTYDALLGMDWMEMGNVDIFCNSPSLCYSLTPGHREHVPVFRHQGATAFMKDKSRIKGGEQAPKKTKANHDHRPSAAAGKPGEVWKVAVRIFNDFKASYALEIDACANPSGDNSVLPTFWHKELARDGDTYGCLGQDWRGKRIWCYPPDEIIPDVLARAQTAVQAHPKETAIVFLLPDRPNEEWYDRIREGKGFSLLNIYPSGSVLLEHCHTPGETKQVAEQMIAVACGHLSVYRRPTETGQSQLPVKTVTINKRRAPAKEEPVQEVAITAVDIEGVQTKTSSRPQETPIEEIQGWRMTSSVFETISALYNLEIDACADASGRDTMQQFWHKDSAADPAYVRQMRARDARQHVPGVSGCLGQVWSGRRIWCHPPEDIIPQVIEKAKLARRINPEGSFTLFLLPDRAEAEWFPKLREDPYFHLVGYFPAGSFLLGSLELKKENRSTRQITEGMMLLAYCTGRLGVMDLPNPKESGFWPPTCPPTIPVPFGHATVGSEVLPELDKLIIGGELDTSQQSRMQAILTQYQTCFAWEPHKLVSCTVEYHRIDDAGAPPSKGGNWRRSPLEQAKILEELADMQKAKVVRPSSSPYESAPVLVSKPDGSTRVCVDYRKLNAVHPAG